MAPSKKASSALTKLRNHWFPDRKERVFVPSFNTYGTVIEICPRLEPRFTAATEIFYLVEMDVTHTYMPHYDMTRTRFNDRSLFLLEELRPGDDPANPTPLGNAASQLLPES